MNIVFCSNFINHHQVHLADALYATPDIEYHFIESSPMPESFKKGGYPDYSDRPYVLQAYQNPSNLEKARHLIDDADVVITGSAPEEWVQKRLKQNKVTFHYSERWFRKFPYPRSPRAWRMYYRLHSRYRNNNSFLLCASAFTSYDASKVFAYPSKCYKWGYFTKVEDFDIEQSLTDKRADTKFRFLFVSRMLKLKHPEMMIPLALYLKRKGYDFVIDIYGTGSEMEQQMHDMIKEHNLQDLIIMHGNVSNDLILQEMRTHHAFLFTSDKQEGWGAVVNEAMSNGCTVVGSDRIGSVPFLINHGETGLIFKNKNIGSLIECAERLITDRTACERMARNGYYLLKNIWSPQHAAANFIELAKSALNGNIEPALEGPCSVADIIKG